MPPDFPWPYVIGGTVIGVAAAGLAMLALLADRSRGRLRCPKCWYDMVAMPGLLCPECGRSVRTERCLRRTRRHWRALLCAILLLAAGLGVWAYPLARASNPWIFAPDRLLIQMLPYVETGGEPFASEIQARRFFDRETNLWSWWGPEEIRIKDLNTASRGLLAREALAALDRLRPHPWRGDLLEVIGQLDVDGSRASPVVLRALNASDSATRISAVRAIGSLRLDPARTVPLLIARAEELHATVGDVPRDFAVAADADSDESFNRDQLLYELGCTVAALGEYGPDARDAIPVLIPLLQVYGEIKGPEIMSDVVRALGRIGPDAVEALPLIAITHEEVEHQMWAYLERLVATLQISGEYLSEEDAIAHLAEYPNGRVQRRVAYALTTSREQAARHEQLLVEILERADASHADEIAARLLEFDLGRDRAYATLIRSGDGSGRLRASYRAQILEQAGLDVAPLIPEIERELESELDHPGPWGANAEVVDRCTELLERLRSRGGSNSRRPGDP